MTKQEPFQAGYYYHVFNRGNNYEDIFLEEQNYHYFLTLTQKYLLPICEIYAYCLIPNHFHFSLRIKSPNELPDVYKVGKKKLHQPFSNMFNAYTKAINKKYHRRGSLFQEHLKRNTIEGDTYFKNLLLYIHLNPNHHGLTESFNTFTFSSYQDYIKNKVGFIKKKYPLELFGDIENFIYLHEQKGEKLREENWDENLTNMEQ